MTREPEESSWINPSRHNLASYVSPEVGTVTNLKPIRDCLFLTFPLLLLALSANGIWRYGGYFLTVAAFGAGVLKTFRLPARLSRFDSGNPFVPELPLRDGEFLVDIHTFVNGTCIGTDRGVLGVEPGLLFFAGSASSFTLGSQDINPAYSLLKSWRSSINVSLTMPTLRVKHPRVTLELAIEIVRNLKKSDKSPSPLESLNKFVAQATNTKLRRQFPPIVAPLVSDSCDLRKRA